MRIHTDGRIQKVVCFLCLFDSLELMISKRCSYFGGHVTKVRMRTNGRIQQVLYFLCLFDFLELVISKMFIFVGSVTKVRMHTNGILKSVNIASEM